MPLPIAPTASTPTSVAATTAASQASTTPTEPRDLLTRPSLPVRTLSEG
jgi:hypothetical protein